MVQPSALKFAGYYDVDNDDVIPSPPEYGTDLAPGPLPEPSLANENYYVEVYACGPCDPDEPPEPRAPPHPSPNLSDVIHPSHHPQAGQPLWICRGDWLVSDGLHWVYQGRYPARVAATNSVLGAPDPSLNVSYSWTLSGGTIDEHLHTVDSNAASQLQLTARAWISSAGSSVIEVYRWDGVNEYTRQTLATHQPSYTGSVQLIQSPRALASNDVIGLRIAYADSAGSITLMIEAPGGGCNDREARVSATHSSTYGEAMRNSIPASLSSSISASLSSSIAASVLNAPPPPGLLIDPDIPDPGQQAPAALVGAPFYAGWDTSLQRWWGIEDGSFSITINGTARTITGLDFRPLKPIAHSLPPGSPSDAPPAGITGDLYQVAGIINAKLSGLGAYVRWTGERFIFNTHATGMGASLGPTAPAGTGTDVSSLLRTNENYNPRITHGSRYRASIDAIRENFRACRSVCDELVARAEAHSGKPLAVLVTVNPNIPMMEGRGPFTSDIRDNFRAIKVITDLLRARYPPSWLPPDLPVINPELPSMGPDARTHDIRANFIAVKQITDLLRGSIPS